MIATFISEISSMFLIFLKHQTPDQFIENSNYLNKWYACIYALFGAQFFACKNQFVTKNKWKQKRFILIRRIRFLIVAKIKWKNASNYEQVMNISLFYIFRTLIEENAKKKLGDKKRVYEKQYENREQNNCSSQTVHRRKRLECSKSILQ